MYLDQLFLKAGGQVLATLLHNWPFLIVSTLVAVAMKLYLNKDAVAAFLRRYQRGSVLAATAAAVATPLCSCGTTAVILGMMAGSIPWAPIIAFMVASPLTSPAELIYSAGLFGWPFALAFFAASIVLGLMGGLTAILFDSRGWLANQARFVAPEPSEHGQPKPAGREIALQSTLAGCACDVPAKPVKRHEALVSRQRAQNVALAGASCGCAIENPAPALPMFAVAQSCSCDANALVSPIPLLPKPGGSCCNAGIQAPIAAATPDTGSGVSAAGDPW